MANPETLGWVMLGDQQSANGGPVLQSNQNSRIFFYFVDHGAPGLVEMPYGCSSAAAECSSKITADNFYSMFEEMHNRKMYKELVIYMEACESGSMFKGFDYERLNIYAVSAANETESSYGTYCPPDDMVNGKHLSTCLGDLFSKNWMADAFDYNMGKRTFNQ